MISKKGLLKRSKLCVIIDRDFLAGKAILKAARLILRGGVSLIQYRDKKSSVCDMLKVTLSLKRLTARYNAILIVNDRLDIAVAIGADGLHLGSGDFSVAGARQMLGADKIIGVSVKSLAQAKKAKGESADYFGAGPIFKTPVKPGQKTKTFRFLSELKKMNIPVFAIGGINYKNIGNLIKKGFDRVAVIRAVCAARNPYVAVKKLREALLIG